MPQLLHKKIQNSHIGFCHWIIFLWFHHSLMAITDRNWIIVKMHPKQRKPYFTKHTPDRVCFGIRRLGLLGFRLYRLNKIGTHDLRLPKEHDFEKKPTWLQVLKMHTKTHNWNWLSIWNIMFLIVFPIVLEQCKLSFLWKKCSEIE